MSDFDDAQLVAYLDGQLDAPTARAIETALATDAALADRMAALHLDVAALQAEADKLLDEAPAFDPALLDTPDKVVAFRPRPVWQSLTGLAAAACVALVIGFGLGRSTAPVPEAQTGWLDAVAGYQNLYSPDSFRWGPPEPREANQEITEVAEALSLSYGLREFRFDGLEFRTAQVLQFNGKPLAQFMFKGENGTPVAICILQNGKPDAPLEQRHIAGLSASVFQSGGYGYVVIGDVSPEFAETTAKALAQRI